MFNPKLEKGDRVVLLHMDGESISPGTKGTVQHVDKIFGDIQYSVKWDNGSTLALISSCDAWRLEKDVKKKIKETKIVKKKTIVEMDNEHLSKSYRIFTHFNMRFLDSYLHMIKDSGIVNMFGAAPYLYMGRERIEHEFEYKTIPSEEDFEKVLDNADKAQQEMVEGVIKILEKENKEVTIENINRYLRKYSTEIITVYISLF
jgi:hypothetical protein